MKRFFICLALATAFSTFAMAQDNRVKPFEFEVGAGMTMGSKFGLDKAIPGPNAYVEGRINLFDTPWDLGVQTSFGAAFRKQGDKRYDSSNKFGIEVFTDYNFRYWDRIAPFVGLGVGRTAVVTSLPLTGADDATVTSKTTSPAFLLNPRAGIELFGHLRLSAEYKCTFQKESSYFALNLGIAFGGGKK